MNYDWISGLITLVIFVISALPLHRAVRWMKGKTTFLKTLGVMIIAGIVVGILTSILPFWSGLIAFVVLIWIYQKAFRLKWYRAFGVWLLHLIFVIVSSIILGLILEALTGLNLIN
jgi:hypothetical protein